MVQRKRWRYMDGSLGGRGELAFTRGRDVVTFGQSENIKALEKLILAAPLSPSHRYMRARRCGGCKASEQVGALARVLLLNGLLPETANQAGNWFIIISLCFHYPG